MSTSLLSHAFRLVGYQYVNASFAGGQVAFRIRQTRDQLRCSHCRSTNVWRRGQTERTFRTLPIGRKPVVIRFAVPRVLGFQCGCTRQVALGFAAPRKSYTRALPC